MCLALLGCLISIGFCSQSWCSWRLSWSIWRCIARWLSQCLATQGVHIISLVIPCPIMNSGSEVLMQTVNYTNRLITHVYECLWCVSAGIQLRLDTWLIRCDSLISCVIAWAWFQPLHRLVPVLSSFGRATSVDVVNLLDSRCTATSRAGFNGWRRGMACHVRLEGEPLMDCLSRQDALCQRIQLHLSLRLEIGLRIVWEDFSECKCLVGCLRLLLFASWISRCQCKHIWRCSRDFCLIQVAVCRSSKLRP